MLVLFDLDGTVIDSLDAWAAAYRQAVHPRGLTDQDIVKDFFHSTEESLLCHGITRTREYFEFIKRFVRDNPHLVSVAADAYDALGDLKDNGHTLGVLTARPRDITTLHCPPELLLKFEVIIDREDALPKPHPDGVFKACKDTGISIKQTVLVGDQPADAKCAQSAGIPFLWYKPNDHPFRNHGELAQASSFSSFKELPGLVDSLRQHRTRRKSPC